MKSWKPDNQKGLSCCTCTHHVRRKKLRRQVSKPGGAEAPDLGPVVDGNFRFIFLVGIELTQNVDKVLLETIQWQTWSTIKYNRFYSKIKQTLDQTCDCWAWPGDRHQGCRQTPPAFPQPLGSPHSPRQPGRMTRSSWSPSLVRFLSASLNVGLQGRGRFGNLDPL